VQHRPLGSLAQLLPVAKLVPVTAAPIMAMGMAVVTVVVVEFVVVVPARVLLMMTVYKKHRLMSVATIKV
jgi:hypothetical protein